MPIYTLEGPDGRRYKIEGPAGATPEQLSAFIGSAPKPDQSMIESIGQVAKDAVGGAVRGAGSIGATLMAPIDAIARTGAKPLLNAIPIFPMMNAIDKATGGTGDILGRSDRRAAMDSSLKDMGANPDSMMYQASKLGGEIAGTAGLGGAIAGGAAGIPMLARLAPQLAPSIASGGFRLGAAAQPGIANLARDVGTRVAGGAISGGAMAGLINPDDAMTGAVIGGLIPPTIRGAGEAGRYVGGVAKRLPGILAQPFTGKGQREIVGNFLTNSATNADNVLQRAAVASELVPGSAPTLGQVVDDAGIAQLERTMVNNPELQRAYAQQRSARAAALDNIIGAPDYLPDLKAGRKAFTDPEFQRAYQAGFGPAATQANAARIQELMSRPVIQKSLPMAMEIAQNRGQSISGSGSIEGIDYLRKSINSQISAAKRGGGSAIGDEQMRDLMTAKTDLMSILQDTSPLYAEAVKNYAGMSKGINAVEAAKQIKEKFNPALASYGATNVELSNAYARALQEAELSIKKSTGMDLPLDKVMPGADIETLRNIAKDLARKSNLEKAGRAAGSNTSQNLATQNATSQFIQALKLPNSFQNSGLLNTVTKPYQMLGDISGSTQKMEGLLTQAFSDPKTAAAMMNEAKAAAIARQQGLLSVQPPSAGKNSLLRYAPSLPAMYGD